MVESVAELLSECAFKKKFLFPSLLLWGKMFGKRSIPRMERPGESAEQGQTSSSMCMRGEGLVMIHRTVQVGRDLGR